MLVAVPRPVRHGLTGLWSWQIAVAFSRLSDRVHPEARMDKQKPTSKTSAKPAEQGGVEAPGSAPAKETKVKRETVTPGESDPLWEELGSTRVTSGPIDASVPPAAVVESPSNYTKLSPTRTLGKNLTVLGDFHLIRKLGEGAMGVVYKAKQASADRIVALKILFPHIASNPKLVERLYREGKVMGLLAHPNIVEAFGNYPIPDKDEKEVVYHCVAMEYISGRSTQKWLTQLGRLPVGDAVRITLDCARALAYAHSLKMVHRDVKPDNILLTKTGDVKLADLGMVKTHDEDISLTQTGHAVGTPWFMPLEQARNAKEIDGRSDIYALGCTLYSFLTGQPPFMGQTIVEVIQKKDAGTFPAARQSNSEVPERLDLIIAKMAAKLPKNRYQNCEDVIKDLESLELASAQLTFVQQKPVAAEAPAQAYEDLGKTSVTSPGKAKAAVDFASSAAVPTLDPDTWYMVTKMPDGTTKTRKYATAQLQKMLQEGMIKPSTRVSHHPTEGYRTVGTYKEFQGAALSTLTKKAVDKKTAANRGLFKKIEDDEREREKAERERANQQPDSEFEATRQYWLGIALKILPIGVAIGLVILLLYYVSGMFG